MRQKTLKYFTLPLSPKPLGALRIGVASTLLLQAAMCAPDYFDWYGTEGFLQGRLMEQLSWGLPQTTEIIRLLETIGIKEKLTLTFIGLSYCISLLTLLVGWKSKFSAVVAWILHLVLGEGHVTGYGIDLFGNIALFYFIWMPVGNYWSLDVKRGKASPQPSFEATLSLRVWQIHLCLVYFISGLEKAKGSHWQTGEAIWRSLMLPIYNQFDFGWLASYPWISLFLSYFTLLVEMGYPLFIHLPKTRLLWIVLTVGMHFGIALFLGLHLFALLMSLFTLCAFGFELGSRTFKFLPRKTIAGFGAIS